MIALVGAGFVLGSLMPGSFPWVPATASPTDIRGSDNVVVASYRNPAATFLVWASGRLTRLDGGSVTQGYDNAPSSVVRATPASGQVVGASSVAVGIAPTAGVTYVVFADGTVKKPRDTDAAKPPGEQRVVWGYVRSGPNYGTGSGDWSVDVKTDSTHPGPGRFRISFNPEFTGNPSIVTGGTSGAYRIYNVSKSGFDMLSQEGHAPDANVPFSFVATGE